MIAASDEAVSQRLSNRGRENEAEIKKRIARTSQIGADLENCIKLENNSSVQEAGDALVNVICTIHAEVIENHSLITSAHSAS